jgi:hypothetical protein
MTTNMKVAPLSSTHVDKGKKYHLGLEEDLDRWEREPEHIVVCEMKQAIR